MPIMQDKITKIRCAFQLQSISAIDPNDNFNVKHLENEIDVAVVNPICLILVAIRIFQKF